MVYSIKEKDVFIPEWNGNKKLPTDKQIKVIINYASAIDVAEAISNISNNAILNFVLYVKEIKNLEINENGKKRNATVEDIYTLPDFIDLFMEIKKYIEEFINIDKKK